MKSQSNYYNLEFPTFKHSNLKKISSKIRIKKNNNYYENVSRKIINLQKEFRNKKFSIINQNPKNFFDIKTKRFLTRAEILFSLINKHKFKKTIKILDFGCNKGELLKIFEKNNYSNLYGYDVGKYFKKHFAKTKINFIQDFDNKKKYFDLIISSHSLNYVQNINETMNTISKITHSNSYLFLNTQNISDTPLNFLYEDQKYHFNKKMIKNLFSQYGKVHFYKNIMLKHELIFNVNMSKKTKLIKVYSQNSDEIYKLNNISNKLKKINKKCNILGANLNSAFATHILNKKIKFILDENIKFKKFHGKKIIDIKKHKNSKLPLLVFFGLRNKEIINRMKNVYNILNIIRI